MIRANATIIGAFLLLSLVIVCCTVLVGLDKIGGSEFLGVVVGPVVGGAVGVIGVVKGVQQGSQASGSTPTPDA